MIQHGTRLILTAPTATCRHAEEVAKLNYGDFSNI